MNSARILSPLLFSLVVSSATLATDLRFIPVSPENTRLADDSPLPEKIESIGWSWRPEKGNGGVFESIPNQERKTAILMVKAAGLKPGEVCEVFGYFWADDAEKEDTHHAVQLGLSLATMHPFDGDRPDDSVSKEPWTERIRQ